MLDLAVSEANLLCLQSQADDRLAIVHLKLTSPIGTALMLPKLRLIEASADLSLCNPTQ